MQKPPKKENKKKEKQQTKTNKGIKKQVTVVRSLFLFTPLSYHVGSKRANDQVLASAGQAPLARHFVVRTC